MPNRDMVTLSILMLMTIRVMAMKTTTTKKLIPNTDFLKSKYNTVITIM